jgi:2-oxoisovalerate dehydrogenase E1 component alpha subunit
MRRRAPRSSACAAAAGRISSRLCPIVIEALSYRLTDHTTADDATRYRSDDDVSRQWQSDPIKRLRTFLTKHHAWTRADEEELIASCRAEVNAAAESYLSTPHEPPEAIFDNLYAELPKALEAQRDAIMRKGAEKKGNGHD